MDNRARDVMNRNVISVPKDMDLRDLAKLFLERGITGAPVVDAQGELAGVVSQTDLIYYNMTRDDELVMDSAFYQTARVEGRHIPSGFQVEDCNTGRVADVMTPVVHSVTETATLEAVARLMTREHIHRVIVRNGRKVTGVISALDLLRARNQGSRPARKRVAGPTPVRTAKKPARAAKKPVRSAARSAR